MKKIFALLVVGCLLFSVGCGEGGGIMIWELTLDAPAEDSLLRVIKSEMMG